MRSCPSMGAPKPTTRLRPMLAAPVAPPQHASESRRHVQAALPMPGPTGRRALIWFGATAAAILVVYLLVPRLAGIEDTWNRIRDGSPAWLGAAGAPGCRSFARSALNMAAGSA